MTIKYGLFPLFFLLSFTPIQAQEQGVCPSVIDEAVKVIGDVCAAARRNEACYGNVEVIVQPQPDAPALQFEKPGDIINLADIDSLALSSLDPEAPSWGVALMKLQANLPDTLPGQNVTILLFGDVEIRSAVGSPVPTTQVTISRSINVRTGPGTTYAVLSGLAAGDSVTADGRSADGAWLRIQLDAGRIGWVFAELVSTQEIDTLQVRAEDDLNPLYRPMQAFYFRSGVGSAACTDVLETGMLIQTPKGAHEILFTINKVNVRLGSTAFFQTTDGDRLLSISVLEGQAQIEAQDVAQIVNTGEQATVPLDANLSASGPPSEPEPLNLPQAETLPLSLLPEPVMAPISAALPPLPTAAEAPAPEVTPPVVPGGPSASGAIIVPGVSPWAGWVDSGIFVSAGQTFVISASGTVNTMSDCETRKSDRGLEWINCGEFINGPGGGGLTLPDGTHPTTPSGIDQRAGEYPLPDGAIWALIARVGDSGQPFVVGAGGTFTATANGNLQFNINDATYERDNTGEFEVTISVLP